MMASAYIYGRGCKWLGWFGGNVRHAPFVARRSRVVLASEKPDSAFECRFARYRGTVKSHVFAISRVIITVSERN
jgi:hypothetical protein